MKTVGDVIAELEGYDKGLPVLVAHDPEGNGYFHFQGVYTGNVEDPIDGYFFESLYTDEDAEWMKEEDIYAPNQVVVIFP